MIAYTIDFLIVADRTLYRDCTTLSVSSVIVLRTLSTSVKGHAQGDIGALEKFLGNNFALRVRHPCELVMLLEAWLVPQHRP